MTSTEPEDDDAGLGPALRQALALHEAPAAVVRAAVQLWPTHGIGLAGAVRRVLASLSFDSATGSLSLATRSSASTTRHLLFSAEGRDIDLRVTTSEGLYDLKGQVLGPDERGTIVATPATGAAGRAELDALGSFAIVGLAPGRYDIELILEDAAIALPPVELGGGTPSPRA